MTSRKSEPEHKDVGTTDTPAEGTHPARTPDPVPFDPDRVARDQIAEHIGAHRVDSRYLNLAIQRHTATVQAAGKAAPLDWGTRFVLKNGGAP